MQFTREEVEIGYGLGSCSRCAEDDWKRGCVVVTGQRMKAELGTEKMNGLEIITWELRVEREGGRHEGVVTGEKEGVRGERA